MGPVIGVNVQVGRAHVLDKPRGQVRPEQKGENARRDGSKGKERMDLSGWPDMFDLCQKKFSRMIES